MWRSASAQTVEMDAMIELSQAGDSFRSYGIPSDLPSLNRMSSSESLAVAGKLHRSKPKHKKPAQVRYFGGGST